MLGIQRWVTQPRVTRMRNVSNKRRASSERIGADDRVSSGRKPALLVSVPLAKDRECPGDQLEVVVDELIDVNRIACVARCEEARPV